MNRPQKKTVQPPPTEEQLEALSEQRTQVTAEFGKGKISFLVGRHGVVINYAISFLMVAIALCLLAAMALNVLEKLR